MQPTFVSLPLFDAPLTAALEEIENCLRRENIVRVITATARLSELRESDLPSHVQVVKRPLKGRRVVIRNARHFKHTRLLIARYPESHMEERAVPALLCVLKGVADIHVGNYVLRCQPGDFVLIPPLVPKGNFSHAVEGNTCDVLYLYPGRLLGEGLECWIAHSQGDKIETGAAQGSALLKGAFLAALFNQLCDEIERSSRSEITRHLTGALIVLLRRELQEGRALKSYPKHLHLPLEPMRDPVKHALAYIESHLHEPLTIATLARETALSATTFKLLFRRTVGHSFYQHLTTLRLEFAGELLRETDLKVQEVAERVGLSPSRLHRLFYTHFSCSPGEYRKRNKYPFRNIGV